MVLDISREVLAQLFAQDFFHTMFPVAFFVFLLVIYCILVWNFFEFISKRDIFHIDKDRFAYEGNFGKFFDLVLYLFKYSVLYPFLTFVFFFGYSLMLIFLSKGLDTTAILLTSISLISTIRVLAYYNDKLAEEVAKLIPLTALAIFLFDPTFFSFEMIMAQIFELPEFLVLSLRFVLFVIFLEWALIILHSFYLLFRVPSKRREQGRKAQPTDEVFEKVG